MTVDPLQYARRWKTLGVLSLSLVIIGLDNTILNVALPTLQDEFDASPSKLQWMVDSYLLVFAGLLLVFGTLGDRFGRKLALQAGVSIFGLASLGALDRRLGQRGDRRARGDGRRRGADHARHPLDHRQPLHRRGAREGDRDLGRAGGGRHRARPAHRRAAARVVRLVVRLPGQRAVRGRRAAARRSATCPRAAIPGPARSTCSEPRSPRPASASSSTRSSRRPSRAGRPARSSDCSRRAWRCSARSSGGSAASPSRCSTSASSAAPASASARRRSASPSSPCSAAIFALTQYLQFAHGYSAIEAGAVMSPMALGLMIGAGSSSKAVQRLGTSRVVAAGLTGLAVLLALTTLWESDTGTLGAGLLVLRPRALDGLGHGARDRGGRRRGAGGQVGRRLRHQHGRAHGLGSTRRCRDRLARQLPLLKRRRRLARRPAGRGARHGPRTRSAPPLAIAAQLPTDAGFELLATTGDAFTQAMGTGLLVAAALAAVTAVVVVRFLPGREPVAGTADVARLDARPVADTARTAKAQG